MEVEVIVGVGVEVEVIVGVEVEVEVIVEVAVEVEVIVEVRVEVDVIVEVGVEVEVVVVLLVGVEKEVEVEGREKKDRHVCCATTSTYPALFASASLVYLIPSGDKYFLCLFLLLYIFHQPPIIFFLFFIFSIPIDHQVV